MLNNHGEDVVGGQNFILLAVNFDFGAAVFTHEHAVALFDFKRNFLSVVVGLAGAEGDDDAFLRLFLGGIGNDDAALFGFLLFDRFHEDAVADRLDVQCHSLFSLLLFCRLIVIKFRRPPRWENYFFSSTTSASITPSSFFLSSDFGSPPSGCGCVWPFSACAFAAAAL